MYGELKLILRALGRDIRKDVKETFAKWKNRGLIFVPLPAFQHFIWPLSYCILADICNHTWIPECGVENITAPDYKMFIDECDMYEYNCDYERSYEVTNYSICWLIPPSCPTPKQKQNNFYRMGNYRFVLEGRRLIYDPTSPVTKPPPVPLPSRMLHGKRRHTPEAKKRQYRFRRYRISSPCGGCHTRDKTTHMRPKKTLKRRSSINSNTLKKTVPMIKSSMTTELMTKKPYFGVVYKRLTVLKDGKVMVKIVKGTATTKPIDIPETVESDDSDFIQ